MQTNITNVKNRGVITFAKTTDFFYQRKIKARLLQFVNILDWQITDDSLVFFASKNKAIQIYRFGVTGNATTLAVFILTVIIAVVVQLPATAATTALKFRKKIGHFLVMDAIKLDIDFRHIDRHQRQTT